MTFFPAALSRCTSAQCFHKNGMIKAKKRHNLLPRLCGFLNNSNCPEIKNLLSFKKTEIQYASRAKKGAAYEKSDEKAGVSAYNRDRYNVK